MNFENEKFIYIESKDILLNPLNDWEKGDLSDLKNNIQNFGLIEALAVIGPLENNKYKLISGERRFTSICEIEKECGIAFPIPCHIIGDGEMSDEMQSVLIDSANLESREMSLSEKNEHRAKVMENLFSLVNSGELKDKDVAKKAAEIFKVSDTYARFYKRIFSTGSDGLKDMFINGEITVKEAAKIAQFSKDKQEVTLQKIKDSTDLKEKISDNIDIKKEDIPTISEIISSVSENEITAPTDDISSSIICNNFDNNKQDDIDVNLSENENKEEAIQEDSKICFPDNKEVPKNNLKTSEAGNEKKQFDFDINEMDLSDLDDIDIDALVETSINSSMNSLHNTYSDSEKWEDNTSKYKLNDIILWCKEIVKKSNPTDEEWDAINACREVAECFF